MPRFQPKFQNTEQKWRKWARLYSLVQHLKKEKKRGEYWIRKTKKNFFFLVMHSTSISEFVPREKKI